jgi:hypothetical protein
VYSEPGSSIKWEYFQPCYNTRSVFEDRQDLLILGLIRGSNLPFCRAFIKGFDQERERVMEVGVVQVDVAMRRRIEHQRQGGEPDGIWTSGT